MPKYVVLYYPYGAPYARTFAEDREFDDLGEALKFLETAGKFAELVVTVDD